MSQTLYNRKCRKASQTYFVKRTYRLIYRLAQINRIEKTSNIQTSVQIYREIFVTRKNKQLVLQE